MIIEKRLKELKLTLVEISKPQGLYVPATQYGNLIMTSGQLPIKDQRLIFPGRVGKEVSLEKGQLAAKAALMNCFSAIKYLCKDLDKIKKIIRMNGYVSSALGFNDQPKVMNAASELLIDIFGEEKGAHTRCAVGVFELPLQACVEVDLTVMV